MKFPIYSSLAILVLSLAPAKAVGGDSLAPVHGSHFTYYCGNRNLAKRAETVLEESRSHLAEIIGDTLPYRPSIHIVDNLVEFNELIGGKFPDWGAAAAFPERKLIAVKSPEHFNLNRSLEELLRHEYAHLVVAQRSGLFSVPRWFDEGVSMYGSMEWSWSDNLAMSKAAVFGQLIDLAEIENVNRFNETKAHVAYAESYLAIKYLIDTYSKASLVTFLHEISTGVSQDEALYAATGLTKGEFESDFRLYLNRQFNVVSLLMDTIFFWVGLSALVIIGGWLKMRKKRQYYRDWDRRERLESSDFDYGDLDHPERIEDDDEPWRA